MNQNVADLRGKLMCDACGSGSRPIVAAKDFVVRRTVAESATRQWNTVATRTTYALVNRSTIRVCQQCVDTHVRGAQKGCMKIFCGLMWSGAAFILVVGIAIFASAPTAGNIVMPVILAAIFGFAGLWFFWHPPKFQDPADLLLNECGPRIVRERHLARSGLTNWPVDLSVVSGEGWDSLAQEQRTRAL